MDIRGRMRNRKSVIFSWVISYIFVLLVPIIISIGIYSESLRGLKAETHSSNESLLMYIQQGVDNKLKDIEQICNEIMRNTNIMQVRYISLPLSNFDEYYLVMAANNLLIPITGRNYIDSVSVFSEDNDLLFGIGGYVTSKELFSSDDSFQGIETVQWKKILNGLQNTNFTSIDKDVNGKQEKFIVYTRTISIGSKDLYAIFVINEENFLNIIQSAIDKSGSSLFILKLDNSVIASTVKNVPDFVKKQDYSSHSGYINADNVKETVITYITSNVNGWKYIMLTQTNIFWGKVKYLRTLIYIGIFLCIAIGILIIYVVIRKNYSSITDLIGDICKRLGIPVKIEKNEFNFLKETIINTVDENDRIRGRINQLNGILRNNFITRILRGTPSAGLPAEEVQDELDVCFKTDIFAVMLLFVEEINDLGNQSIKTHEAIQFIHLTAAEILEGLTAVRNKVYITDMDGVLACLVNLYSENMEEAAREIRELAGTLQQKIKEKMNISITISFSGVQRGAENITYVYRDALEAMEIRAIKGSNAIIGPEDMRNIVELNYNLPHLELNLITYIKSGDIEKAKSTIEDYLQVIRNNSNGYVQIAKCTLMVFFGAMVKALNEVDNRNYAKFLEELRAYDRLSKCETIAQMRKEIFDILKHVCEYTQKAYTILSISDKKLYTEVEKYIDQYYHQPNITSVMIGEHFKLTPYYLSRLFKEQSGQGLLEYINRVRIQNSRLLLKEREQTIQDISSKVGYTDVNTFIRQFKKFEGMTPGKFREVNMNKNYYL